MRSRQYIIFQVWNGCDECDVLCTGPAHREDTEWNPTFGVKWDSLAISHISFCLKSVTCYKVWRSGGCADTLKIMVTQLWFITPGRGIQSMWRVCESLQQDHNGIWRILSWRNEAQADMTVSYKHRLMCVLWHYIITVGMSKEKVAYRAKRRHFLSHKTFFLKSSDITTKLNIIQEHNMSTYSCFRVVKTSKWSI